MTAVVNLSSPLTPSVAVGYVVATSSCLYCIFTPARNSLRTMIRFVFGGGFTLQVRFEVYKDCLLLLESLFKMVIEEVSNENTHKFKTELTFDQLEQQPSMLAEYESRHKRHGRDHRCDDQRVAENHRRDDQRV
ncbi:putative development/cell death domain-containing protein [Helianthus debilis subsp. tardiflorus]